MRWFVPLLSLLMATGAAGCEREGEDCSPLAYHLKRYPVVAESAKGYAPKTQRDLSVMAWNLDEAARGVNSWIYHFRQVSFVDPEIIAWADRFLAHATKIGEALSQLATASRAQNMNQTSAYLQELNRLIGSTREFTPVVYRKCKIFIE